MRRVLQFNFSPCQRLPCVRGCYFLRWGELFLFMIKLSKEAIKLAKPRFLNGFTKTESGCWEWVKSKSMHGYGWFQVRDKSVVIVKTAHRAAWLMYRGGIPKGLHIDHLCRNRACVNPFHMRLLTMTENVLCGVGPSAKNKRKTHCLNGHIFDTSNTNLFRERNGSLGRQCKACRANRDKQYYLNRKNRHAQEQ